MKKKTMFAFERLARHRRQRRSTALRSGIGCVAFRGASRRGRSGCSGRPTTGAA